MTGDSTRAAVERIRDRIPPEWGKWIDCGEGWWPLLARLGDALTEIEPNWVAHQVKQKYSVLEVYYEQSILTDEQRDAFDALITEASLESSRTCETCGQPGERAYLKGRHFWIQTMCDDCMGADPRGRLWTRERPEPGR